MTTLRSHYQLISAVALVVGVALITVAEMPSLHWTRIFGATAISLGALGVGIYVGLSQPGRYAAAKARLATAQRPLGLLLLVVLFLPALAGLGAGVVGLFSEPEGTGWVVAVGAVVLVLMLAATVAAFVVGYTALAASAAAESDDGP